MKKQNKNSHHLLSSGEILYYSTIVFLLKTFLRNKALQFYQSNCLINKQTNWNVIWELSYKLVIIDLNKIKSLVSFTTYLRDNNIDKLVLSIQALKHIKKYDFSTFVYSVDALRSSVRRLYKSLKKNIQFRYKGSALKDEKLKQLKQEKSVSFSGFSFKSTKKNREFFSIIIEIIKQFHPNASFKDETDIRVSCYLLPIIPVIASSFSIGRIYNTSEAFVIVKIWVSIMINCFLEGVLVYKSTKMFAPSFPNLTGKNNNSMVITWKKLINIYSFVSQQNSFSLKEKIFLKKAFFSLLKTSFFYDSTNNITTEKEFASCEIRTLKFKFDENFVSSQKVIPDEMEIYLTFHPNLVITPTLKSMEEQKIEFDFSKQQDIKKRHEFISFPIGIIIYPCVADLKKSYLLSIVNTSNVADKIKSRDFNTKRVSETLFIFFSSFWKLASIDFEKCSEAGANTSKVKSYFVESITLEDLFLITPFFYYVRRREYKPLILLLDFLNYILFSVHNFMYFYLEPKENANYSKNSNVLVVFNSFQFFNQKGFSRTFSRQWFKDFENYLAEKNQKKDCSNAVEVGDVILRSDASTKSC